MKTIDTHLINPKKLAITKSLINDVSRCFWVLLIFVTCFLSSSIGQIGNLIATNKSDYFAGENVILTGQEWQPGALVKLKIIKLNLAQEEVFYINSDENGELEFSDFVVIDSNIDYQVEASYDLLTKGIISTTTFTNTSGLFQAHNGGVGLPPVSPIEWVKGNAHGGNSHYMEGESIPYRIVLRSVEVGQHELLIGFDTRDGGKAAIDFITSNNRISEEVNPIIDLEGPFSAPTYCAVPVPLNSLLMDGFGGNEAQPISTFNKLPALDRRIVGYNAILDSAVYVVGGSFSQAHSEAQIMIYFHTIGEAQDVVISWGGHISSRIDWGAANSAAGINGSPYHTRLISFDGIGGNQDRSLKTDAVIFIPSCGVEGEVSVCSEGNYVYTASTNAPFPTYSWQVVGDASIVSSSTNSSVTIEPGASGSYSVSVIIIDNSGEVESEPSDTCYSNVQIIVNPIVSAGDDQAQCIDGEGAQFALNGTVSSGSVLWEVISGEGNFSDATQLNSTFDLLSASATLRLNAVNDCQDIFDDVILTLNDLEKVSILGDDNNCLNLSTELSSSLIGDYTYSWSIEGNASIEGADDLATVDAVAANSCDVSYTISLQITDNATGCQSSDSRLISFSDTIAPVISGLATDTIIECTSEPFFTEPLASDECDAEPVIVVVSDETTQGECANEYSRTLTWKAVDACGNESELVSQTIQVIDDESPVISGQGQDGVISCTGEPEFIAPTAIDNCDEDPEVVLVSDESTPGECSNEYSRTLTWKAVDACGNESEPVSQTIQVIDDEAPVISGQGQDGVISCTEEPEFTAPTALDNCDESPEVILVSDILLAGECSNEYSRTLTWKAADACGNESDPISQTIQVIDDEAPTISGQGQDGLIECPAVPEFTVPTGSDNCGDVSIVEVTDEIIPYDCVNTYLHVKSWVAIDACGNASDTVTQQIMVVDETAPTISDPGVDLVISCFDEIIFTPPTEEDNCGEAEIVELSRDTLDLGNGIIRYTVSWQAVDACGNESEIVAQSIEQTCSDPIYGCSLTQGFYGNANGIACATGERGIDLMFRLLGPEYGDLVIGVQGRSFTIEQDDLTCLILKLPAGGPPAKLPQGDNSWNSNCVTGTSLDVGNKLKNVFLGQVITLGLNLRLDNDLGAIQLEGTEMTTYRLIASDDGLCATDDDIIDEGSIVTSHIPASVLSALDNQYNGDRSIYNLYRLANRVIGGEVIAGLSISNINKAISSMNEGFDECRALGGFTSRQFNEFDNTDVVTSFKVEVFPNPFAESTTVTFSSDLAAAVKVELFSSTGQLVQVLFHEFIDSETNYRATIDGNKLMNGVYFCKITVDEESQMTRILLNK